MSSPVPRALHPYASAAASSAAKRASTSSSIDAASQLVELREPEAICLLHDHDRRVRDVDADLDHGRGDEHVELTRLEARHQIAPLERPQAAVEQADAVTAELGAAQTFRLCLRRSRLRRLRLLDQRTDHVRL